MIIFKWYKFTDLSLHELYKVLALRSEVFVVGQECIYLDADGRDFSALHLLGSVDDEPVAYLRLLTEPDENNEIKFGRVLTKNSVRSQGYGKKLMQELMDYCERHFSHLTIKCSAQLYLQKFYESYGFKTCGDVYVEENMPHILMRKD
jgi:ElaA protein